MREVEGFFRIEISGGIVSCWHGRSAQSVAEVNQVLSSIDDALDESGISLLLFDSREADRTPEEVQGRIWSWLTNASNIRKVATVMKSEMLATSVRMTGIGKGVRIKAFHDEAEARTWLVEP